MRRTEGAGSSAMTGRRGAGAAAGRVWSTGCILVVCGSVLVLVVVVPALLWAVGILFGH